MWCCNCTSAGAGASTGAGTSERGAMHYVDEYRREEEYDANDCKEGQAAD